jgi:hypothetical protein
MPTRTDADGLERIRAVVECDPDAIKWLRLVLVGGERLERILADPAAAALASRLCARVRVPAQSAESLSSPAVRITALATFSAALVALSLWYFRARRTARSIAARCRRGQGCRL